jgi:hypothetical protein
LSYIDTQRVNVKEENMPKIYNTEEYREAKRITAFVAPELKERILSAAGKAEHSVSHEVGLALEAYYDFRG